MKKPPTLDEVKEYIKKRDSSVDPVFFYEFFTAGDWHDSRGKKVINWKQKVITWENFSGMKNEKYGENGI